MKSNKESFEDWLSIKLYELQETSCSFTQMVKTEKQKRLMNDEYLVECWNHQQKKNEQLEADKEILMTFAEEVFLRISDYENMHESILKHEINKLFFMEPYETVKKMIKSTQKVNGDK